ncbi:MAG: PAS domain S-box protein [Pseudomonadota bacterium]
MAGGQSIKRHLGVFLPAMLSVALFGVTIFWVVLPQVQDAILAKKREMIRELTLTVTSLLSTYEQQARTGLLSEAEAQRRALLRVRDLRYGDRGKDYFWITDLSPRMLMHPYRSDLEGKNVANYADQQGKRLFSDFVAVVRQHGEGYVSYIWQWKDDPRHLAEKISHVRLYKPWGWIVGTGMYADDVQAEMGILTGKLTLLGVLVWLVVTLLAGFITWRNLRVERERREAQEALVESEEKFRGISSGALDAVIMIDPQGKIIFWNRAAQRMFGYAGDEAQGMDLHLLLAPQQFHPAYREAFEDFKPSGEGAIIGQTVELTARRKNGEMFPVEISVSSLNLRDGWHAVGILRDITARRQAERDLEEREKLYRALFESAGDAIILLRRGVIVDCNSETLRMMSSPHDHLVGRPMEVLFPDQQPGGEPSVRAAHDRFRLAMQGQTQLFDWVHRRLDGTCFDSEVRLSRVDLGEVEYVLALVRDTSARKQAEAALRQSEANLRKAQAIAHLGNWSWEAGRDHLEYSDEVARILDLPPAAGRCASAQFLERVAPDQRQVVEASLQRALADGEAFQIEHQVVLPIGRTRWVVQQGGAELDEAGRPLRLLGTIRDVTAAKQAQEEKARLEEQLRQSQKLEAIGTLAGGIAHDFNNVLQTISGHAQLVLDEEGLSAPAREWIGRIEQSTQRAAEMIRRLMTLGRKVETRREKVDINWEIGQTIQVLTHTLPKMISIKAGLDPELPPVLGDPGQLEQVFLNLANNAGQAMPEGGVLGFASRTVRLTPAQCKAIACVEPGDYVQVEVSDTGEGMSEAVRARIFEPFFTTKPLGQGTGLGLSTVYAIIANHHGQIICDSEPGHGACFRIYLPAQPRQAAQDPAATAPEDGPVTGSETVLLVDDEEAILESCGEALVRAGYRVRMAGSGEEALAVLSADPAGVDLVVLDLGMPGMGGLKCLEVIMALGGKVRVLMATGYASETVVRQIMALGAGGIINKPYGFGQLLHTVRQVLDA